MRTANAMKPSAQMASQVILAALSIFFIVLTCTAQHLPLDQKIWDGPENGPRAQSGKKITFISQDFRNGGIAPIYRSFSSAASILKWQITLIDGIDDAKKLRVEFAKAIDSHQDAIVLGGIQAANQEFSDLFDRARKSKIVIVGWHASAEPGPTNNLFVNIATSSTEVAKIAVGHVTQSATGQIGIIIFNDSRYDVANAKTDGMKDTIKLCARCKLLSVENIKISEAHSEVPLAVTRLNQHYGKTWTHTLAINDAYFDSINMPLLAIGRTDIQNVSAGDGSSIALSRIASGKSQQVATVAEPLGLQGWQLADELNRAFAGQPPSGYTSKPVLVTTAVMTRLSGGNIDSDIPYKKAYTKIWTGAPPDK